MMQLKRFFFNKKGDLSLSTNSIVILIIAITVLGLAIAFSKNIFDMFGRVIPIPSTEKCSPPPTEDNPLTRSKDVLELNKGSKGSFTLCALNKYSDQAEMALDYEDSTNPCQLSSGNGLGTDIKITLPVSPTSTRTVNSGSELKYAISLVPDKELALVGNSYLCSFKVFVDTGSQSETLYKEIQVTIK
jgi:hypothetical protein